LLERYWGAAAACWLWAKPAIYCRVQNIFPIYLNFLFII
jgi:hypothetical protein